MIGLITVRASSTRLPEKCLLPFGDINVLQHVIRRAQAGGITPIVCTTYEKSDDRVAEIAKQEGVRCFRGSVKNKLKRWLDCCDFHRVTAFHTIDADDPFFDCHLVKESLSQLANGFDIVFPSDQSASGAASVGYSLTTELTRKACQGLGENDDTEMMWNFIKRVPDIKSSKLKDNSKISKIRLTLDYIEDYWLLQAVRIIAGSNAEREKIETVFQENPDLYKINWFRNIEWSKNQEEKGQAEIDNAFGG